MYGPTGARLEGEGTIRDPRKGVLEAKKLRDKRRIAETGAGPWK